LNFLYSLELARLVANDEVSFVSPDEDPSLDASSPSPRLVCPEEGCSLSCCCEEDRDSSGVANDGGGAFIPGDNVERDVLSDFDEVCGGSASLSEDKSRGTTPETAAESEETLLISGDCV
jgi:hypothetical protein